MTDVDHVHDRAHDHRHGHPHGQHEHEAGLPPPGGPVVVDIGGDVGALIVHLHRTRLGTELHLRRNGWAHTVHTSVWDRPLADRRVTVAVYPALSEGSYQILDGDGAVVRTVSVEGGCVTELDLRG
jgi:hypothetical protein